MNRTLAFRVEADPQTGLGHFMRCLALAEAHRTRGGQSCFIMSQLPAVLKPKLERENISVFQINKKPGSVEDAAMTLNVLRDFESEWLITDGYCFGDTFQKKIAHSKNHLLVIDDYGQIKKHCADIIVDQNFGAEEHPYQNDKCPAKLLLGPQYIMFRREFFKYRDKKKVLHRSAKKWLMTMGGGDDGNLTLKILSAVSRVDQKEVKLFVVLGPLNPNSEILKKEIEKMKIPVSIVTNPPEISNLMADADLALSSAGTTLLQLVFMGVPTLAIATADNQIRGAEELQKRGLIAYLGKNDSVNESKIINSLNILTENGPVLRKTIEQGQALIDGYGAERILNHLDSGAVKLRKASRNDCKLIWELANDPVIRDASFSNAFIPWEDHVKWFETQLNDPHFYFYIIMDASEIPIGSVRFDVSDAETVVSASIGSPFRGKGYGTAALRLAVNELFKSARIEQIHAYIKPENKISVSAFINAGFKEIAAGKTNNAGMKFIRLVCEQKNGEIR